MKAQQTPFGIVPVEVAMDPRLTLQQMRVLLALYTFRNRNTEMAHPTREEIRERTGMALPKISTATTDLERLGWLTKVGNGGRSQATRYRVHVPETMPDQVTVTEQGTVTQKVTVTEAVTVTESGTKRLPNRALNGYRIGKGQRTDHTDHTDQPSSPDKSADRLPACPHKEIIALFAEQLPELPQPKAELWDGPRAKALTARWRWCLTAKRASGERYATTADEALAWFGKFFRYVRRCPHLMGNNSRGWTADLGWLVKAENFAKVQQGNYEPQPEAA